MPNGLTTTVVHMMHDQKKNMRNDGKKRVEIYKFD